jgi:hypothetical protein
MNKLLVAAIALAGVAGIAVGANRLSNGCCPLTGGPICVRTGEPLADEALTDQPGVGAMSESSGVVAVETSTSSVAAHAAISSSDDPCAVRKECSSKKRKCSERNECGDAAKTETKTEAPAAQQP